MWNEKSQHKVIGISLESKDAVKCLFQLHFQTEFKGQNEYCIRKQKAFQSSKGGRNVRKCGSSKSQELKRFDIFWGQICWENDKLQSSLHLCTLHTPWVALFYISCTLANRVLQTSLKAQFETWFRIFKSKSIQRVYLASDLRSKQKESGCSTAFANVLILLFLKGLTCDQCVGAEQHIAASNIPCFHNTCAPSRHSAHHVKALKGVTIRHHLVVHQTLESSRCEIAQHDWAPESFWEGRFNHRPTCAAWEAWWEE